jgi:uncharacterized protein involved in exopolysaccharide biosynthesis
VTSAPSGTSTKSIATDHETHQSAVERPGAAGGRGVVSVGDLISIGKKKILLLLLAPVGAALIAYAITSLVPARYTSVAYLKLDEAGARSADALMRSPPVLDKVIAGLGKPEGRIDVAPKLNENRRIVVAAGDFETTAKLFRLEYTDREPRVAQQINHLFIDAWLATAGTSQDRRAAIEAEIQRRNVHINDLSQQINWITGDLTLRASAEKQSEILVIIKSLLERREEEVDRVSGLMSDLNNFPMDTVFSPADLPAQPSWPQKGIIAILAGAITALGLLAFVVLSLSRSRTEPRTHADEHEAMVAER